MHFRSNFYPKFHFGLVFGYSNYFQILERKLMAADDEVHLRRESPQKVNGALSNHSSHADQTDLPANRRDIPYPERVENKKVHWFWDLVALGSLLTFIADIGSDLFVAGLYFSKGQYTWFGLTLGFVFLSSFTLQIFSAKWLYEDTKDIESKKENWLTYVLHILHLGPIIRYWRVFRSGCRTRRSNCNQYEYHYFLAEWRDICMLRLFEAYLESAPQLVLQLYILAYHRRFNTSSDLLTAITASCSLVSLAWAIVAYTNSLRDVMKYKVSWMGFFFQIMWRLSMLASRIVSMVLFASFFGIWLFVCIGAHWLIMFLFLVVQYTDFCMDSQGNHHPCREVGYNGIVAFIYNFSFFNITQGSTRLKLFLFYFLMFLENTASVVMWYPHSSLFGDVSIAAISMVYGGFIAGLIFMLIYYQFYHPNIEEKGFCFMRGRQLEVESEHSYLFTRIWCCCCEVRAMRNADAVQDESNVIQRPPTHSGDIGYLPRRPHESLEILPRHFSNEEIPRLVSGSEALYLKASGRNEVTLNSPVHNGQASPEIWI